MGRGGAGWGEVGRGGARWRSVGKGAEKEQRSREDRGAGLRI